MPTTTPPTMFPPPCSHKFSSACRSNSMCCCACNPFRIGATSYCNACQALVLLSASAAESTSAFAFQGDEGEGSARRPEHGLFQSMERETHLDPFRQFGTPPIRMPSETAVDTRPQPDQWQSRRQETSASPFARAMITQQPTTPERPETPETPNWIDQLSRGMGELVVHSESRPVSAHDLSHPEDRAWVDELSRSMGELVVHGEQPAERRLFSAPQLEFRPQYTDLMDDFDDGMNELAAQWQEQAATRARPPVSIRPDEPRNPFARPRPRPPATPQVSLNTLAGDASVLLELFSQRPDDGDNITGEHETMITSAADGISAIQARLRQRAARGNRDVASRELVSRDADCVICYSNGADVVFMPCKHLVVCNECCDVMGIDEHRTGRLLVRCPMCRSVVVESIKVFRCS